MDLITSTVKYINQEFSEAVEDRASQKPIIIIYVQQGETSLAKSLSSEEKNFIKHWNSGFGIRIVAYDKSQWYDNSGHLMLIGSAGKMTHQDMTNRFKKFISGNNAPIDIAAGFKRNELFPLICYVDDNFSLVASSDSFSPENDPTKGINAEKKEQQMKIWLSSWQWLSRLFSTKDGESFEDGLRATLNI